jgi:hypothetical protein
MAQLNACEEFVVAVAAVGVVVGVAVVDGADAADVAALHVAVDVVVAAAAAAAVVVAAAVEDDGQYQGAEFDSYKVPTWRQLVVQSDQQDVLTEVEANLQLQA